MVFHSFIHSSVSRAFFVWPLNRQRFHLPETDALLLLSLSLSVFIFGLSERGLSDDSL